MKSTYSKTAKLQTIARKIADTVQVEDSREDDEDVGGNNPIAN